MSLLSIVLPIYNVEKYLEQCICSLIGQEGFEECEVLLVDDGSGDSSPIICDEYEKKFDNIVAYHKTNGGLSDARNYGLERAKGEYVLFLDSDDYLEKDAIKKIIQCIEEKKTDVILYDAVCVNEQGGKIEHPEFEFKHEGIKEFDIYSGEEAIKQQLINGCLQTTVWLGAYRKDFLLKRQLWFKKGLLHEDELWTPMVLINASSVSFLKQPLYCYRIRDNSIMRDKNKDHSRNVESYIYIYNYLISYYLENVQDKDLLKYMLNDLCRRYLYVIKVWDFWNYSELAKKIDERAVLKYSTSLKNKIRAFLLCIKKQIFVKRLEKQKYEQSNIKN